MSQEAPKRAQPLRGLLGLYNGNRNSLPPVDEVKEEPVRIDLTQEDVDEMPEDEGREPEDGKDSKEEEDDNEVGNFRVAAKHVLVTYAKCGDHRAEDLEQHVRCVCKEKGWDISALVGADEKHADKTNHVHFAIKFVKKPNLTRADTFDLPCDCGCGKSNSSGVGLVKCTTVVDLDEFEYNQFLEYGTSGLWLNCDQINAAS